MDEESAFNIASIPGPSQPSIPPPVTLTAKQQQQAHQKQKQQQKQARRSAKQSALHDRPPSVPHRDLFHRVNFTYQASVFLAHLGSASAASGRDVRVRGGYGDVEDGREAGPSGSDHHDADNVAAGSQAQLAKGNGNGSRCRRVADRKGKQRAVITETSNDLEQPSVAPTAGRHPEDDEAGRLLGKLARRGMKENKRMAAHNLLKLDPSLKRAICKSCSTVLIPGLTSRIRNRPNQIHMHKTHQTCLSCQTQRSIPTPPNLPIVERHDPTSQISISTESKPGLGTYHTLHGPKRLRRILRSARSTRIPFHLREQPTPRSDGDSGGPDDSAVTAIRDRSQGEEMGMSMGKGHALWVADQRTGGWGIPVRHSHQSPGVTALTAGSRPGADGVEEKEQSGRPVGVKPQKQKGSDGSTLKDTVQESTAPLAVVSAESGMEVDEEAMFNM